MIKYDTTIQPEVIVTEFEYNLRGAIENAYLLGGNRGELKEDMGYLDRLVQLLMKIKEQEQCEKSVAL